MDQWTNKAAYRVACTRLKKNHCLITSVKVILHYISEVGNEKNGYCHKRDGTKNVATMLLHLSTKFIVHLSVLTTIRKFVLTTFFSRKKLNLRCERIMWLDTMKLFLKPSHGNFEGPSCIFYLCLLGPKAKAPTSLLAPAAVGPGPCPGLKKAQVLLIVFFLSWKN